MGLNAQRIKSDVKLFWTTVGTIAVLVGLFVGLRTIDSLYLYWPIVGVGVLAVLTRYFGRAAKEAVVRYRKHPGLQSELVRLTSENEELRNSSRVAKEQSTLRYNSGVEEGIARIFGAELSRQLDGMPRLTGVALEEGKPILLGQYTSKAVPERGTRFSIGRVGMSKSIGVVQVKDVDLDRESVVLTCVDKTSEEFWEEIRNRADRDPSPPGGVELREYDFRNHHNAGGQNG